MLLPGKLNDGEGSVVEAGPEEVGDEHEYEQEKVQHHVDEPCREVDGPLENLVEILDEGLKAVEKVEEGTDNFGSPPSSWCSCPAGLCASSGRSPTSPSRA